MNLVSHSNPGYRWLFQTPYAGVSVAQWMLLCLATPVYGFSAWGFHRVAFKSLHGLWKHKNPWTNRFFLFGNMEMLNSLGTSIAYLSSVIRLAVALAEQSTEMVDDCLFYFDTGVFLTMFLLVGRAIESWCNRKTKQRHCAAIKNASCREARCSTSK